MTNKQGSIVCVGLGMVLGAHLAPLSRKFIEEADVVFMGVTNVLAEQWLQSMNENTISLQPFYQEGKDRRISYQQMVDAMLSEVRKDKKVVGAFYGHPGVFAWAPHKVIEKAKEEGFHGHMEPGISAEDCLYSDMGIDPGEYGISHYEASQFIRHTRIIDQAAYLILWQIGFVGDLALSSFQTEGHHRQLLMDVLLQSYPPEHRVAIYESATLPTEKPSIKWIPLSQFGNVKVEHHSTMVIPPSETRQIDGVVQAKLQNLLRAKKLNKNG